MHQTHVVLLMNSNDSLRKNANSILKSIPENRRGRGVSWFPFYKKDLTVYPDWLEAYSVAQSVLELTVAALTDLELTV